MRRRRARRAAVTIVVHPGESHESLVARFREHLGLEPEPPNEGSSVDRMFAAIGAFADVPRRDRWAPPRGERIGGVPPWQGGRLLERGDAVDVVGHGSWTNQELWAHNHRVDL